MSFANPAAQAQANAAEYVEQILGVLGGRDPLLVMEEQFGEVKAAVAGVDEAALRRPEAPGKWSMVEVVQHLADTELVYGYRVRMTLSLPTPPIQGYDQDLWARELKYRDAKIDEALEQLGILRRINLRLLRSLDDRELDRFGIHSERGPESVRQIVRLIGGHDLVHRRQLKRIRQVVSA
jgi:DinB superfamily